MFTTILRAAAMLAFVALPLATAVAEDDLQMIEGLSPKVSDLVSGGSWSQGKEGGFYRAISITSGDEKSFGARIYVQWLALEEKGPIPRIVKTVPVKEINAQNLSNASIELEGEEDKDNEIKLTVSSYDFDADKDIVLLVKLGLPGTYAMMAAPGSEGPPAKDAAPAKPEAPGEED